MHSDMSIHLHRDEIEDGLLSFKMKAYDEEGLEGTVNITFKRGAAVGHIAIHFNDEQTLNEFESGIMEVLYNARAMLQKVNDPTFDNKHEADAIEQERQLAELRGE